MQQRKLQIKVVRHYKKNASKTNNILYNPVYGRPLNLSSVDRSINTKQSVKKKLPKM